MAQCPICDDALFSGPLNAPIGVSYNCRRCGQFQLAGTVSQTIDGLTMHQRAVLSHRIRCQQRPDNKSVTIFEADLSQLALDDPLPTPAEQIDRMIVWLGERQRSASHCVDTPLSELSAWIGASITGRSSADIEWFLQQGEVRAVIRPGPTGLSNPSLYLSMDGWRRYEAIKHSQIESRTAFMAMQFDKDLIGAVNQYFKPAVARAGFELKMLTDDQPAGLIDDQLRVALRTARFVIADLTHANNGAYWEAGFAEGLGRPVIYTCRKTEWDMVDDRGRRKVHFDTSHLVTIIWSPDALQDAADRLTATIRATLPSEARMRDE